MKKTTLAIMAIALGAGAAYFLDPRQGPRRRRDLADQARGWLQTLEEGTSAQMAAAADWVDGMQQRLSHRGDVLRDDDDGLEPLSMTPPALEQEPSRHSRMLPALAIATPVALAVGAALLHRREDDPSWLH